VVSQFRCVLLTNLLYFIATGFIFLSGFISLSPTMGEGPHWVPTDGYRSKREQLDIQIYILWSSSLIT
jgi:hypothetical protein